MPGPGSLPEITHLQFFVLTALRDGECAGRMLREQLRRRGVRRTAPAFYQMMARLEDAGLVEGAYAQRVKAGRGVKERRYRITPAGEAEWRATCDFYRASLTTAEAADV